MMYASVDMGGTKIACGIAKDDGVFLAEESTPTLAHEGPQAVLARIASLVAKVAAGRPISGLGIGVPGLVDLETGREPFFALLTRIARRSDSVGEAARSVLARWFGS